VTLNGFLDQAVNPAAVILIGWYEAPAGTVTVSDVGEAVVTIPRTAPKNTTLLFGLLLNPVPVMVTIVPTGPVEGENALMIGWENICCWVRQARMKRNFLMEGG
jgi:hypothetical protein